ncbi:MAG: DUF3343 domain-containing protein [Clostridia bacterium]|nr:DUF3343 domain-containing protein [Clostridia bacterium]
MKYLILSFNSRNSIINFSKILHLNNITTKIINTPHKISSSCSLSIKTEYVYLPTVSNLIKQTNPSGFIGLYLINEFSSYSQVSKII